jgi:hypothetical protein
LFRTLYYARIITHASIFNGSLIKRPFPAPDTFTDLSTAPPREAFIYIFSTVTEPLSDFHFIAGDQIFNSLKSLSLQKLYGRSAPRR